MCARARVCVCVCVQNGMRQCLYTRGDAFKEADAHSFILLCSSFSIDLWFFTHMLHHMPFQMAPVGWQTE